MEQQEWYVPYMELTNGTSGFVLLEYACLENYAVYGVSISQYIFLALAYAKGKPYREIFVKNYLFTFALAFWTGFSLYLLIDPNDYFRELIDFELPPMSYRFVIVGFSVLQVKSFHFNFNLKLIRMIEI